MQRIASAIKIAPEGVAYAVIAAIGGIAFYAVHFDGLAFLFILLAIAIGAFFRDPDRLTVAASQAVLSAADGKVVDVSEMPLPGGSEKRFHRVSVFMSPIEVHVNRAPVSGRILEVTHMAGEFRAAYRDDASEHNERNFILIEDSTGRRHAIMQVAGYLARRIVCRVRPDDLVERGQRVGMIMFGSRVDHFLPLDFQVKVVEGEHVRAGESIIGEL
jgi:phosphatidylserine decarboxylase